MTCKEPGCDSIAAWTCRDGAIRCTVHALEWSPLKPLRPPGIVAAVCPPGWRRDPLNGRPVMPCLGKLLFPCALGEIPGVMDVSEATSRFRSWLSAHSKAEPFDVVDDAVDLIGGVLLDAAMAKKRGGEGLSQNTEVRLSALVQSILRTCGEVRIVKTGAGWEEVGT